MECNVTKKVNWLRGDGNQKIHQPSVNGDETVSGGHHNRSLNLNNVNISNEGNIRTIVETRVTSPISGKYSKKSDFVSGKVIWQKEQQEQKEKQLVASYKDVILKGYHLQTSNDKVIHPMASNIDFPEDIKWLEKYEYCYQDRKPLQRLREITVFEKSILEAIMSGELFLAKLPTFLKQIWPLEKISLFDLTNKRRYGGSLYFQLLPGMHLSKSIKHEGIMNNIFRDQTAPELRKKRTKDFKSQVYTATYKHELRVVIFSFIHKNIVNKWVNTSILFRNKPVRLKPFVGTRLHQRCSLNLSSEMIEAERAEEEPTVFNYCFRIGNIDSQYELWDISFFLQHILELEVQEIFRTINPKTQKDDMTQWTVILTSDTCPEILLNKTCLFWEDNYVFIHHCNRFPTIPCSWCLSPHHHYNSCKRTVKNDESHVNVLCLKTKTSILVDNSNPWGVDNLQEIDNFNNTFEQNHEDFLLSIYQSLPWELPLGRAEILFPNYSLSQKKIQLPIKEAIDISEEQDWDKKAIVPAKPEIVSENQVMVDFPDNVSTSNFTSESEAMVEEKAHLYMHVGKKVNSEKRKIKKKERRDRKREKKLHTNTLENNVSPDSVVEIIKEQENVPPLLSKTVDISKKKVNEPTSNIGNEAKFKQFVKHTNEKSKRVYDLLQSIQGKEAVCAAKGHCMFLSFLISLKNSSFISSHKLFKEEEEQLDWMKKAVLGQFQQIQSTFYHNFDGMLRDFEVIEDLTKMTFDEKVSIIRKYFQTIISTSSNELLSAKYWGNSAVLDLLCLMIDLPIFVIEQNTFVENLEITKISPIEPRQGVLGMKVYTEVQTLNESAYVQELTLHQKSQGVSCITLIHKDQSHYDAVLFPGVKHETLDWQSYLSIKTFSPTPLSNMEQYKGHPNELANKPQNISVTPQMIDIVQQLDGILHETNKVVKRDTTGDICRSARRLSLSDAGEEDDEKDPVFDVFNTKSCPPDNCMVAQPKEGEGRYGDSLSSEYEYDGEASDTPARISMSELRGTALQVMEDLLEPFDQDRVAAYANSTGRTFNEAKAALSTKRPLMPRGTVNVRELRQSCLILIQYQGVLSPPQTRRRMKRVYKHQRGNYVRI